MIYNGELNGFYDLTDELKVRRKELMQRNQDDEDSLKLPDRLIEALQEGYDQFNDADLDGSAMFPTLI